MHRIAGSLSAAGYDVTLAGRERAGSAPLGPKPFRQKRIRCLFEKGFLFYAEYNVRLFFYLLAHKADLICAVDLDTILPVYFSTALKGQQRVYDAHELFTEQKEIITRPFVRRFWLAIERFAVPRFRAGYTVNNFIAGEFGRRYGVAYGIIRNLPKLTEFENGPRSGGNILYQGAVNEGRSFETLIPAMAHVNTSLDIYGEGNFFEQAKKLALQYGVLDKIHFHGYLLPSELRKATMNACFGLTLFEPAGLNQYHSLSNRFFDYIMAGIPQLCVNYPEYAAINAEYKVAYLVDDLSVQGLAAAMNNLLSNDVLREQLRLNCLEARKIFNWEEEEKALLAFYNRL